MPCLCTTLERNLKVQSVARAQTRTHARTHARARTKYWIIYWNTSFESSTEHFSFAHRHSYVSILSVVIRSSSTQNGEHYKQAKTKRSALPGYYAANSGNSLPTFRDNLSVPSSRLENPNRNHGGREQAFPHRTF